MSAVNEAQIAIFTEALGSDAQRAYEVLQTQDRLIGCVSFIQRKLGIRYERAITILAILEQAGVITAPGDDGVRAWTV